jgi:hypothetical protein
VGIVIPNPGQWLLPEFQDLGRTLQTTLQLPPDATIGHGISLEPTSDGFLIWLPSGGDPLAQPSAPKQGSSTAHSSACCRNLLSWTHVLVLRSSD